MILMAGGFDTLHYAAWRQHSVQNASVLVQHVRRRRVTPLGWVAVLMGVCLAALSGPADAHGITGEDAAFVAGSTGPQVIVFLYLGAKHMVTGFDHLLFILGVIFFLYRLKDVALYVTMFSVGHSITLLSGALASIHVNPYLVAPGEYGNQSGIKPGSAQD